MDYVLLSCHANVNAIATQLNYYQVQTVYRMHYINQDIYLNNKTYFFHFRAGTSPVTIAFRIEETSGLIVWDSAFCSNKDSFTKSVGRKLSEARLNKRYNKGSSFQIPITGTVNVRLVRHEIVAQLKNHPDCPQSFSFKF